jgi:hypothetical protein
MTVCQLLMLFTVAFTCEYENNWMNVLMTQRVSCQKMCFFEASETGLVVQGDTR